MQWSLYVNSKTIEGPNVVSKIAEEHHFGLSKIINHDAVPDVYKRGFVYAVEKMGDLFSTQGSSLYHITSAYCYELLYEKSKEVDIPIIAYPAVENNHNSVNWAIHPRFADSDQMALEEVFEVSISDRGKDHTNLTIHKKGVFENNVFSHWEKMVLTIVDIQFKSLQLLTYNKKTFKGLKAAKLLMDNNFHQNVQNWINYIVHHNDFSNMVFQQIFDSEVNNPISESDQITTMNVIIQFNHGNIVNTKFGKYSVHRILVPITWKTEFKKQKN